MSSFLENFNDDKGIKTLEYDVDIDKSYKKKKKNRLVIEVILILLVLVSVILLIINFSKVKVPNFNNKLYSVASSWASKSQISIIKNEVFSDKYEEGYIIKQNISSGTKINKKDSIEITVSKGPNPEEVIKFPDLNKMIGSDIKSWIDDNKLINTTLIEQNSEVIEKGKIISYSFKSSLVSETNFKRNDELNIIISKGNIIYDKDIEVINFINKTKDDAIKWCSEKNIVCIFNEVLSDSYENLKIVSQSIKVAQIISKEDKITFDVSVGKGIIVPNYFDVTSENASSINNKFDIKIKYVYNMSYSYGKLISQSVKAGTKKIETDNKIELVYSLGKPYFSSLVGTSVSEVAKIFYDYNSKGVNFTYEIIYVNSDKDKGSIVETSKSNEFVTMNENIIIKVSNKVE